MEASAAGFVTAEPKRTSNVGRVALVIAALLAGAASAAAVIAALHYYDVHRRASAPEPEEHSEARPPRQEPPHEAPAEPPEEEAAPVEPEPQPEPPVAEVPPERPRHHREPRADPDLSPPAEAPFDPIREAQRALHGGDPQRCIDILNEAIRSGDPPAIVLRRRGDCLEAAGRREDAVRDYQRFCRIMPDHPSISQLRPLLESWGRSCP
jgi:hypothetical protein